MQTGVLTLVAATVPPTIMIATVVLERLERYLLGPGPGRTEPGPTSSGACPRLPRRRAGQDRATPPIDGRGGAVPTDPIRQSQPRRRISV